jgi:hypothetical protein
VEANKVSAYAMVNKSSAPFRNEVLGIFKVDHKERNYMDDICFLKSVMKADQHQINQIRESMQIHSTVRFEYYRDIKFGECMTIDLEANRKHHVFKWKLECNAFRLLVHYYNKCFEFLKKVNDVSYKPIDDKKHRYQMVCQKFDKIIGCIYAGIEDLLKISHPYVHPCEIPKGYEYNIKTRLGIRFKQAPIKMCQCLIKKGFYTLLDEHGMVYSEECNWFWVSAATMITLLRCRPSSLLQTFDHVGFLCHKNLKNPLFKKTLRVHYEGLVNALMIPVSETSGMTPRQINSFSCSNSRLSESRLASTYTVLTHSVASMFASKGVWSV